MCEFLFLLSLSLSLSLQSYKAQALLCKSSFNRKCNRIQKYCTLFIFLFWSPLTTIQYHLWAYSQNKLNHTIMTNTFIQLYWVQWNLLYSVMVLNQPTCVCSPFRTKVYDITGANTQYKWHQVYLKFFSYLIFTFFGSKAPK